MWTGRACGCQGSASLGAHAVRRSAFLIAVIASVLLRFYCESIQDVCQHIRLADIGKCPPGSAMARALSADLATERAQSTRIDGSFSARM